MNHKPKFLALLMFLFFAGCLASNPVLEHNAIEVDASRVYHSGYLVPEAGTSKVSVIRDNGFAAAPACLFRILVDGAIVADLKMAEKVVLYLPFGDHTLGVDSGFCAGRLTVVRATVAPESEAIYRVGYDDNGHLKIK